MSKIYPVAFGHLFGFVGQNSSLLLDMLDMRFLPLHKSLLNRFLHSTFALPFREEVGKLKLITYNS